MIYCKKKYWFPYWPISSGNIMPFLLLKTSEILQTRVTTTCILCGTWTHWHQSVSAEWLPCFFPTIPKRWVFLHTYYGTLAKSVLPTKSTEVISPFHKRIDILFKKKHWLGFTYFKIFSYYTILSISQSLYCLFVWVLLFTMWIALGKMETNDLAKVLTQTP